MVGEKKIIKKNKSFKLLIDTVWAHKVLVLRKVPVLMESEPALHSTLHGPPMASQCHSQDVLQR